MSAIEHSATAFTEAREGEWGVLWAHAPDREACGAYRTRTLAATRAQQTLMSAGGMKYTLVKRARTGDVVANGYLCLPPYLLRDLYGEPAEGVGR